MVEPRTSESEHDAALHQVADDLQVHRRSTHCHAALAVTEQSVTGHDPGNIARDEIAVVMVEAIRSSNTPTSDYCVRKPLTSGPGGSRVG